MNNYIDPRTPEQKGRDVIATMRHLLTVAMYPRDVIDNAEKFITGEWTISSFATATSPISTSPMK